MSLSNSQIQKSASRFDKAGVAQPFPGNTVLIRVVAGSRLHKKLQSLVAVLTSALPEDKIAWLPAASWHITLAGGVCEFLRDETRWPPGQSARPLKECTSSFAELLACEGVELERRGLGPPYAMRTQGLQLFGKTIWVTFTGSTDEEELRLRSLKNRIADTLGFRHPNHAEYAWHVSLAYLLEESCAGEEEDILSTLRPAIAASEEIYDFGPAEFCTFKDMASYETVCTIGSD
ncbi:hypothetical protein NQ176_g5989 [Zarea fungicola]|uniref:Uncharacterized protein n=1 Tax=Zarea fungicola TaxID=93591 RepID=A0ACC1N5P2_9HYPO|nr:hypothetical protein NQ176_g5989 [Lecanicillium fungicola]